jgi:hypothetical protein
MKTRVTTPLKTLALVAFLSLAAGAAQADSRSCPLDSPAPAARQAAPFDMNRIEAALQSGQITPYEAGRLMRQQWELAQFQRGFLAGAPKAAPSGGSCGLSGGDMGDIGDMAGTVAGSVAKNGIQTATKVMRALMREGGKLIREEAAGDEYIAF